MKTACFVQERGEKLTHGHWSSVENLLFVEVMNYIQEAEDEPTVEIIHRIYNEVVNCINLFGLELPACSKSIMAIAAKREQHLQLQQSFYELTQS